MSKVSINLDQLADLYHTAMLNSTLDAFGALAVDWAKQAETEIDRLRAENKILKEWRPIDTAPQDGSLILLGWWRTWSKVEFECEVKAAGNIDTGRPGTRWMHGQATHWMPLPEPPELRGEEE